MKKRGKVMKEFWNRYKTVIGLGLIILIIIIVGLIIILNKDKDEKKVLREATHTMYVKINPTVKLDFKIIYYECLDDNGKVTYCADYDDEVMDFELINDDAKEFYNEMDFKGKTVIDSLISLCDIARDNKVSFENLTIVSDHNFDEEKIMEEIKNGSKYHSELNVYIDFKEMDNEDEIKDSLEKSEGIESTIEKINLNENILFYHSGNGFGGECLDDYKIFATNIEELFPGSVSESYYDNSKTLSVLSQDFIDNAKKEGYWSENKKYVLDTDFEAKFNQIKYDEEKEKKLVEEFDKLSSEKFVGIDGFDYNFKNHKLTGYSYGYIELVDKIKFSALSHGIEANAKIVEDRMNSVLEGHITVSLMGGCGDMPEPELLTEKVCKQYNLVCDRW